MTVNEVDRMYFVQCLVIAGKKYWSWLLRSDPHYRSPCSWCLCCWGRSQRKRPVCPASLLHCTLSWPLPSPWRCLRPFCCRTRPRICKCRPWGRWGSWTRFPGTFKLGWGTSVQGWCWQVHWSLRCHTKCV